MTRKLSKTQRELLEKIASGEWELGTSTAIRRSAWIQRGGIGRGGEVVTVNHATVHALYRRGMITYGDKSFPTRTWKVTEKGRRHAQRSNPNRGHANDSIHD